MVDLTTVYAGYRPLAQHLRRVPGSSAELPLHEIKHVLPTFFAQCLTDDGRSQADYTCYGGHGEANRTFANIPWVACCRRSITRRVRDGYFIVLLFREDMSGAWLSLNQGYTQYERAFAHHGVARRQAKVAARALSQFLDPQQGFHQGDIDLGATTPLGMGYEAGAILSRFYSAQTLVSDAQIASDFRILLAAYDKLEKAVGANILKVLPDEEGPFQAAAAELAKKGANIPDGPRQPVGNQTTTTKGGWRRDPSVAAQALRNASYNCEVDVAHTTFIARSTGENFVEAHHLIPIAEQSKHAYSLDVPDNIVALCPICHRLFHHGKGPVRMKKVLALFQSREPGLKARGIQATEASIREIYRHALDDD